MSAALTSPILPDGVRVGAGIDLEERPAVRLDLTAVTAPKAGRDRPGGNAPVPVTACAVFTPRQARALGALLLKQADLVEGGGTPGDLLRAIDGGRR